MRASIAALAHEGAVPNAPADAAPTARDGDLPAASRGAQVPTLKSTSRRRAVA